MFQGTSPDPQYPGDTAFIIKDSVTLLLIIFCVGVAFSVLLCFYPGRQFLGGNFWPLIALPALPAIGSGIKLISSKPILRIDYSGIKFFRSGIFIPWTQIQSAKVISLDNGDDEVSELLSVIYFDKEKRDELKIEFLISGSMNKNPDQVAEAVNHYMP